MEKPVPQVFAETLVEAGIEQVFGIPGGCTPAFFDALVSYKDRIRTTLARHEGGAAVMADAYAKAVGKPALLLGQGLWIATSGGFGIAESYSAGVPMVILCDLSDYQSLPLHGPYQNGTGDYGSVDVPAIFKAMTKFCTVASNPSEFVHGLRLAVKHARSGRPGPAAVLVKWNVPFQSVDTEKIFPPILPLARQLGYHPPVPAPESVAAAVDLLASAERPVILLGQGAKQGRAGPAALDIARRLGAPVVSTFLGKSAVPEVSAPALGVAGALGRKAANEAVSSADVLLAVGTSLAPDNTKWLDPRFIRPETRIIHIDLEPRNMGWTFAPEIAICSDSRSALESILRELDKSGVSNPDRWADLESTYEGSWSCPDFKSENIPIAPERVVAEVQSALGDDDVLVLDGGNNRMWFTHHFRSRREGQVISGGGVAAIGYAAPAALAVKIADPSRRVLAVLGDGGLLMSLHALESARDLGLGVVYLVMNNSMLGNVYDYQPEGRKIATEYSRPNFEGIGKGMGVEAFRIRRPEELGQRIRSALYSRDPVLLDVDTAPVSHFKLMGIPQGTSSVPAER